MCDEKSAENSDWKNVERKAREKSAKQKKAAGDDRGSVECYIIKKLLIFYLLCKFIQVHPALCFVVQLFRKF